MSEFSEQLNMNGWGVLVTIIASFLVARFLGLKGIRKDLSGAPTDRSNRTPIVIFTAFIAFIVLFSTSMLRHDTFHSKAWDLAIFDQVVWNLANGYGWECSVRGVQDLRGDHFSPILLIFVPLYKIYPHVGWLLAIQALALIGAGLILWATYRSRIGYTSAMYFFIAYCFYPPIHWLANADFHPIALAPFFVALAWMGRYRQQWLVFLCGIIGLTLCGEEGLIVAGWWGLWELFVRRKRSREAAVLMDQRESDRRIGWLGLGISVACFLGFYYLATVYIPSFRAIGESYFYIHRYEYLGNTIDELIKNFFLSPELWISHMFEPRSIGLMLMYLAPFAFLPILRPKTLCLLIPTIIYTLISESAEQKTIFHQYTSVWIPFMAIATAEALILPDIISPMAPNLRRARPLLFMAILTTLAFSPIIGWSMKPAWFTPEPWAGEAKGIIESISPEQAVAAPSALCPHLSHRRDLIWKDHTRWEVDGEILTLPDFPPNEN